jgi:hypothetical protein
MTDSNDSPADDRGGPDLRTVTTRLADLQRKCRSVGLRTNEATEMEERIGAVLRRLESSVEEPDSFADLARQLFPVERFFESNGFLSVSKEVAHVERTLEGLAGPLDGPPAPIHGPEVDTVPEPNEPPEEGEEDAPPLSRWTPPKPMIAVFILFMVAVAVCTAIILYENVTPTVIPELPSPTPPPPTPAPTATAVPRRHQGQEAPSPGARLAEEIGKARLALADGDVELAMTHISLAALIDADHAAVLGAAEQAVNLLVQRGDGAAEQGDWPGAEAALERARGIATRFGLDPQPIEDAAARHATMTRYRKLAPTDISSLRAAAGRRITIHLKDGSTRESVADGLEGAFLVLAEDTTVRGGTVTYTDRIPLADIEYVQVWDD